MIFGALRKRDQAAAFLSVPSVTWQTFTRSFVVESSALGVNATNAPKAAWVLAMSIDTSLVEWAVVVVTAAINAPVRCADFSIPALFISSA